MTRPRLTRALLLAAAVLLFVEIRPAAAAIGVSVDINLFHDALAPYGDWVQSDSFGPVWTPARVEHGWRPYTRGHWVVTDFGWTWAGDEEWGWATDHYGRWAFDASLGWIWVPGSQWGPAWVAWRHGGGFVGWAPLPPGVAIDAPAPVFEAALDPLAFTFVQDRFLVEVNLGRHFLPIARNVTCVRVTNNITNYTVVEDRVVNRGVEVDWIARAAGRPIPRLQVRAVESIEAATRGRARGQEIAFYQPRGLPARVDRAPDAEPPSVREAYRSPRAAGRSVEAITRQEKREAEQLDQHEERERRSLMKSQEREERRAAPGPSLDDLRRRHEAELKTQDEHAQRERQALEARQHRERGADRKPDERPRHHR